MKYRISAIKPISLLLTTLALAVVTMACEEAAPRQDEPAVPSKPAGVPPSIYEPLNDVSLTASGSRAVIDIDLDHHFYDPDGKDGETLTYEASSSDSDTVKASLAGRTLILRAMAVGTAKIFVKATDKDDLYRPARFDATVVETAAPQIETGIPDQELSHDDEALAINLAKHFTHERAITYAASSDPAGVVDAEVADETLTVTPLAAGHTLVTVTASADGQSVDDHFIVVVTAGSEPTPDPPDTPTPADAPQKISTIPAQVVDVRASSAALDVSAYFSPTTGLTYTAVSSDLTKATATIPTGSSSLTITGVAAGTATVTVTAADSNGRTATLNISVTVTDASSGTPSAVTIAGVTKTEDLTIEESQTLQSLSPAIVTATRKADSTTVWTLAGVKKGTASVRIWNADRTIERTISVTVENSPPTTKKDAPVGRILAISDAGEYVDENGLPLANDAVTPGRRQYHLLTLDYSSFFEDPDADDIADDGYRAESNEPYVKVVKVLSSGVVIDVTKDVGFSFPLVVYVVDKSGSVSEHVTLTAPFPSPLKDVYEVTQAAGDGDFSDANVWQREGVTHTLTFAAFKSGGTAAGFHFVEAFEAELTGGGTPPVTGTATFTAPATIPDPDASVPPYYTVTKTGPVEIAGGTGDDPLGLSIPNNVPTLKFRVTGSGRATMTITYHVVVDLDGGTTYAWEKDFETLTMKISGS